MFPSSIAVPWVEKLIRLLAARHDADGCEVGLPSDSLSDYHRKLLVLPGVLGATAAAALSGGYGSATPSTHLGLEALFPHAGGASSPDAHGRRFWVHGGTRVRRPLSVMLSHLDCRAGSPFHGRGAARHKR